MPNAVTFNGTSQYLTRAYDGRFRFDARSFSVAAWAKLSSKAASAAIASVHGGTSSREWLLSYALSLDEWTFTAFGSGGSSVGGVGASTFGSPSTGSWHLIIGVVDTANSLVKISVDGGAFDSVALTGAVVNTSNTLYAGARYTTALVDYFPGSIQDLQLYGRALSLAECQWLYNSGSRRLYDELGRTGNDGSALLDPLAEWWDLTERAGNYNGRRRFSAFVGNGTPTSATGVAGEAASPLSPEVFLSDDFSTAGNLTGSVADVGGTWTAHEDEAASAVVSASGGVYSASATNLSLAYLSGGETQSPDVRISFDLEVKTVPASGQVGFLLNCRNLTGPVWSSTLRYLVGTGWQLARFVNDSFTAVATYNQTFTPGQTYAIRIDRHLLGVRLWVDGEIVLSAADDTASLHRSGWPLYRAQYAGTPSAGFHVHNLSIGRGWKHQDAFLLDGRGGSAESAYGGVRVPTIWASSVTGKAHVACEARYNNEDDYQPSDMRYNEVNLSTLVAGTPVNIDTTNSAVFGTGNPLAMPQVVVLPSGRRLAFWARLFGGYTTSATVPADCTSYTLYMSASDDGATWETPLDITSAIGKVCGTQSISNLGPAPPILLASGRIVLAYWYRLAAEGRYHGHLVYTDTFASNNAAAISGVAFTAGGVFSDDGDATNSAGEIGLATDGDGYLVSFRNIATTPATGAKASTRHIRRLAGVASDWSTDTDTGLNEVACHGAISGDGLRHYHTHCNDPQGGERRNITLRWSDDSGVTWSAPRACDRWPEGNQLSLAGGHYASQVYDASTQSVVVVYEYGGQPAPGSFAAIAAAVGVAVVPLADLGLTATSSGRGRRRFNAGLRALLLQRAKAGGRR